MKKNKRISIIVIIVCIGIMSVVVNNIKASSESTYDIRTQYVKYNIFETGAYLIFTLNKVPNTNPTIHYGKTANYGSTMELTMMNYNETMEYGETWADIKNLEPNTVYHYKLEIDNADLLGKVFIEDIPLSIDQTFKTGGQGSDIDSIKSTEEKIIDPTKVSIEVEFGSGKDFIIEYGINNNAYQDKSFSVDANGRATILLDNLTPNSLYEYRFRQGDQTGSISGFRYGFFTPAVNLPDFIIRESSVIYKALNNKPILYFETEDINNAVENSISIGINITLDDKISRNVSLGEKFTNSRFIVPTEVDLDKIFDLNIDNQEHEFAILVNGQKTQYESNYSNNIIVKKILISNDQASGDNISDYTDNLPYQTKMVNIGSPDNLLGSSYATIVWETPEKDTVSYVTYYKKGEFKKNSSGSSDLSKIHSVKLENLDPATTYQYYISFFLPNGEYEVGSLVNEFTTKPKQVGLDHQPSDTSLPSDFGHQPVKIRDSGSYNRLKGKIMLKVEDAGKAYYVNPKSETMHYLGRPNDAFSVMREQGVGITNKDLYKIPVGISNSGTDTDGDGLSDDLEKTLGLDPNKNDTDGDGYSDNGELSNGYNPWGEGKQNIDNRFSSNQKGKILLQVEKNGEAWYVNPSDGRRYFLGRPVDAFNVMRNLGLGISDGDFNSMIE